MQAIFDVFFDGMNHLLLWLIPFTVLIIALQLLLAPHPRRRDGVAANPGTRAKTWIGWGLLAIAVILSVALWTLRGSPFDLPHSLDAGTTALVTASDSPQPPRPASPPLRQSGPTPPPSTPQRIGPAAAPQSGVASLSWVTDKPMSTPISGTPPDCALARADLLIKDTDENRYQRDQACR